MKTTRYLFASILLLFAPLTVRALTPDELPTAQTIAEVHGGWKKDDVYVYEFWATWCAPCRKAMPHMEALWQEGKDEGIHVIGVNMDRNRDEQQIRTFLAQQPTPPTYPMVLDRENAFAKAFGVRGIPHVALYRNGQEVWSGHPNDLSIASLRVLRETGTFSPQVPQTQSEPAPSRTMADLEKAADEAAAKGDWQRAVSLQREAFLMHPLQQRLEKLFLPAFLPERTSRVISDAPTTYLEPTLKLNLPISERALTVVSLWKYPWWTKQLKQTNAHFLPGVKEVATFTAPYRSITLIREKDKAATQTLLSSIGSVETDLNFLSDASINAEELNNFFKVDDRYAYPFVAIWLGDKLLYRGALEAMPEAFKGPLLTAEGYTQAMQAEEAAKTRSKELFLAVRSGKQLEEALQTRLTSAYASLAMPYFFSESYQTNDVAAGSARLDHLINLYKDDDAVLRTLLKVLDTWPALSDVTAAQQETIALTLAQRHPKAASGYALEDYLLAADAAQRQSNKERTEEHLRAALKASPQAKRLAAFEMRLRPLPAN